MVGVQILSFNLISELDFDKKIEKILSIVKKGNIVLIDGRLDPKLETELISSALKEISGKFTGIEIAHLNSFQKKNKIEKIKEKLISFIVKNRLGITVIGPSKIIKEIKMDPQKLEILLNK